MNTGNYHPISILTVLSKVLEKVVATQLMDFLQDSQLLHPHQFGFRPGYSTETANCCFVENMKQSLDQGNVSGAVFLCLKKAFNTVNHSLLLSKMLSFHFSPDAIAWFTSYLQDREQCVKVDQDKSFFLNNHMGIPQGSILGPLLFSLLPQYNTLVHYTVKLLKYWIKKQLGGITVTSSKVQFIEF